MRAIEESPLRWKSLAVSASVALLFATVSTVDARAAIEPIERPPNLVLIIGDDHGWPYAGFMGSDIVQTPNLDALAASGTVFTHVFAPATFCRPTLEALLSGLDGNTWNAQFERTNITFGGPEIYNRAVLRFQTLPRQLERRGYTTFQAGKHWEGTARMAGFREGTATTIRGFADIGANFGRPSIEPMSEFLDSVGETPFFLWLAPKLPHVPLDPPEVFRAPYENLGLHGDAVLYYANITRLDHVVGQILDELRARGLDQNTLIVYLSDNGWEQAPDRRHFQGTVLGGSRGKGSIHDLGHRTPAIFHWPGVVPEGRRTENLATFEDIHASLLDYAGAPLALNHPGRSLRGQAEGNEEAGRERVFGFSRRLRLRESEFTPDAEETKLENAGYVRDAQWRYIFYGERNEDALYRIDEDPFERVEVSDQYPEVVAELSEALRQELLAREQPAESMEVVGKLRRLFGEPVAGLPVVLFGTTSDGNPLRLRIATGADGTFRFPSVPAGQYQFTAPVGRLVFERRLVTRVPVDLTGLQTGPHLNLAIIALPSDHPKQPIGTSELVSHFVGAMGQPRGGLATQLRGWTRQGHVRRRILSTPDGSAPFENLAAGIYGVGPVPWGSPGLRLFIVPDHYRVDDTAPTR